LSTPLASPVVAARTARFVAQGGCRHDLTGCAVSALEGIVLDEGCLDRMQNAVSFQSFDRDDVVVVMHDGERETRQDAATVDMDSACAALAMIAALLGSEELELLARRVEQCDAGVHSGRNGFGLASHRQRG